MRIELNIEGKELDLDGSVTITVALLIVYFTLLRTVINLKMTHNYSRDMSMNESM
jgi:hypothetical protein